METIYMTKKKCSHPHCNIDITHTTNSFAKHLLHNILHWKPQNWKKVGIKGNRIIVCSTCYKKYAKEIEKTWTNYLDAKTIGGESNEI